MRIVKNRLDQGANGILDLIAENFGDLQALMALLTPGVQFGCASSRKILIGEREERKQVKLVMKITRAQLLRTEQTISINGTITLSSNPDVPLGSSHQYFLAVGQKFTLARHWSAEDISLLEEEIEQQCEAIVVLSSGVARIALVGETVQHVDRLEYSIPGKDGFNQSKIDKATAKFIEAVILTVCNKVDPMPLVITGEQEFVEMIEREKERLAKYSLSFIPTKAFTTKAVISELVSQNKLDQQAWWGIEEALDQIRSRLMAGNLALYSQDVLCALEEQPQAIEKAFILESLVNDENRVSKLVHAYPEIISRVSDYSEPANVLRSLGGAACLLKYEIWLDEIKEEGKVFTAYDEFEDSQESELT